mmetsp:Transcript_19718/g.27498  ORF Transcript_19718/g.27498 Transcript_19718/m.27498 type:complete len:209 (-) Transcript_19718:414-1040(-)
MLAVTKRSVRFTIPSDSVEWDQIDAQEKNLYKEDQAKRLSERESEQNQHDSNDSTFNPPQEEEDDDSEHCSTSRPATRQRSHSVATTSHKTLLEEDNNSNSPFSPLRSILKNASVFKWNSDDKEKEQNVASSFDGPSTRARSHSTSSTTNYNSSSSSSSNSTWRQKIQQFQQKFERVWSFITFKDIFEVRGPSNQPKPRRYKYQRQSV